MRGPRSCEPRIDFRFSHGDIGDATSDPNVLALVSSLGRVLVAHDFKTMPGRLRGSITARRILQTESSICRCESLHSLATCRVS